MSNPLLQPRNSIHKEIEEFAAGTRLRCP